jgi:putative CocE/NonD family hydrolase
VKCGALLVAAAVVFGAGNAHAAMVTKQLEFTASDGVRLHAIAGGDNGLTARPAIIEFSPYAPGCCNTFAGPAYNYVVVHARGTGESAGQWSATGPRDQQDVAEFLDWACRQPWSDGRLALYGFSASAIVAYNSMHLELPCLKTAVLMAGTADLYRDLLYIGGIPNQFPASAVMLQIAGQTLASAPGRSQHPETGLDPVAGDLHVTTDYANHPSEDRYWLDRSLRPSALRVPLLIDTGFYDVESRGPFLAYEMTRQLGSHLMIMGAHEGAPAGTGGQFPAYKRWLDHYVLGEDNGVDRESPVQAWVGRGSRERLLAGGFVKLAGDDWPLPGTRWTALRLSADKSGTAQSLNDGTLTTAARAPRTRQSYPGVLSNPFASDPYTTAVVGATGGGGYDFNDAFAVIPGSTQMNDSEPQSLTYTSPPLRSAFTSVGPAALHVRFSSTAPEADIYAVVADVWPDGSAHPVAAGRLRNSYPRVIRRRSEVDRAGREIVRPYNDFSEKTPAAPGTTRDYDVELWPIGNSFDAGHRIRLYLTGTSGYMQPPPPGVSSVEIGGGRKASRLILPGVGGGPRFAR